MLNQDIVLALLQASITGAGLVFAAYALILTLQERILKLRAEKYAKFFNDLYSRMNQLSSEKVTEGNQKKLMRICDEIKALNKKLDSAKTLPTYLRFGMGTIFFGYIASTLASVLWLIGLQNADSLLLVLFTASTVVFLVVGLASIREISSIMAYDYEKILGESLYRQCVSVGLIDEKQTKDSLFSPSR